MNEVSYDRLTRSLDNINGNKIELKISRKINGDKIYTIEIFEKNDEEYLTYNMQHKIADYIINKELPTIFYFDDFRDTFSGTIELIKNIEKIKSNSEEEIQETEDVITYPHPSPQDADTLKKLFFESFKDKC